MAERPLWNGPAHRAGRPGDRGLDTDKRAATMRWLLIGGGLVLSLAILLRVQIETGFTAITGDIYDGRIEISLLEHWFNVLCGIDPWNRPGYFYPHADTLGYNDGYLLFGLIFSLFRLFGIEPILASEFVNICVRIIGYGAFIALAVDLTAIPLGWATLGAILFTISNGLYTQEGHQQLLSVCFAPLLAWLLLRAWRSLESKPRRAAAYGASAGLLYGAWLLTGFYMAWFASFFALLMLLAVMVLHASSLRSLRPSLAHLRRWPVAVSGAVGLIAIVPFLSVYLPTAAETGQHSLDETLTLMPTLPDIVHVGSENLLYGAWDRWMTMRFDPAVADIHEHIVGFSPLLLLLACLGVWMAFGPRLAHRTAWRALAIATVAALALSVQVGGRGLWPYVYGWVPGAAAIRAETRLLLFLDLPVVLLATMAMAFLGRTRTQALVAVLAIPLVLGEINLDTAQRLDRPAERAVTDSLAPAPASCKAFYMASRGKQQRAGSNEVDALYHHTVDAMMISAIRGLPTINGYATFVPRDIPAVNALPVRIASVRAYARDHAVLQGLCGLDLDRNRWIAPMPPPALLPSGGAIRFASPDANDQPFLAGDWSHREPAGRWTDGFDAGVEMTLPADDLGRPLSLSIEATPFDPPRAGPTRTDPSPLWLQVNGRTVAHWLPAHGQQHFAAVIPADIVASGPSMTVNLLVERPMSPLQTTGTSDDRKLGLMLHSLSIAP